LNRVVKGCLPYAGLALAGVLIFPFLGGMILFRLVLVIWILGFGMFALAKFRHGLEGRGKYDLQRLRAVHEREEIEKAGIPLVAKDADEVVCPQCGTASPSRISVCPACGSVL